MGAHLAFSRDSISSSHQPFQHNGRFMVGEDPTECWIVSDERHLAGGIFADRAAAMHFALAECEYDPQRVCIVPKGSLSLDTLFGHDLPARRERKFG